MQEDIGSKDESEEGMEVEDDSEESERGRSAVTEITPKRKVSVLKQVFLVDFLFIESLLKCFFGISS